MSPLPVSAADKVLLERVLRESGAAREAPSPSFTEYAAALMEALWNWLSRRSPRLAGWLDSRLLEALVWLAVATVAVLVVLQLVRWLQGRSARSSPLVLGGGPVPVSRREALRDWRAEIEEHLRRGDPAAAVEALWWWLARSLCGAAAEASWTSRELLKVARRDDLRPLAATLDRMAYGSRPPTAADVRGLVARFEEALA